MIRNDEMRSGKADTHGTETGRRREWLGYKLRSAAFNGDLDGVEKAHEQGAQINSSTTTGWTALDFSTRECHDDVSAYLRRNGGRLGEPVWVNAKKKIE